MAKSKLKSALERYQSVDHKAERDKKLRKQAERNKKQKKQKHSEDTPEDEGEEAVEGGVALNGSGERAKAKTTKKPINGVEDEVWETDEEEEEGSEDGEGTAGIAFDTSRIDDTDSSSSAEDNDLEEQDELDEEDDEEEDIPLSDIESLASEDRVDIIPHQRLTINNTTALLKALKSISLPTSTLPFSEHMTVITDTPTEIPDINDDLNRELAFYSQSLSAAKTARSQLKAENLPFSRPTDYFAEMVKSDEHMGKIKQKLIDEAASKKAASDARRQRDLKKFGKQVQIAKLQERDKAKRDTIEKINLLKRKRQGADLTATEDDMFDVALEDAATTERNDRAARRASGGPRGGDGKPNPKRARKDQRYGFGGKKRFAKSNDARSSGDVSGFSTKRMKGKPRLGKSRRARRA